MILESTPLLPEGARYFPFWDWPNASEDEVLNGLSWLNRWVLLEDAPNSFSISEKEMILNSFMNNLGVCLLLAQRSFITVSLTNASIKEGFHFHAFEKGRAPWMWGGRVPSNPPPFSLMEIDLKEFVSQMRSSYSKDSEYAEKTGTIASLYFISFVIAFLIWDNSRRSRLLGNGFMSTNLQVDSLKEPMDFLFSGRRFGPELSPPPYNVCFSE